nr:uncharacterized protein LOC113714202 [Coffea arabica]
MRVFRWTRDFHVHIESSLVPVWVDLPNLPIHYFDKHFLFSILSPIGRPLFLDSATTAGTRPSVVRVCVEIDVAKIVVPRIWVAVEGELGFWQRIVPDNMPSYCSSCWRLGHSSENCKKNFTEIGYRHNNNQSIRLQRGSQLLGNNQHALVTPVCNIEANGKVNAQLSRAVEDEGTTIGVMEKTVESALLAEEGETILPQDDKSNCVAVKDHAVEKGRKTEPSAADAYG